MNLPKLFYFVPCERPSLDSLSNRVTLSFVFESIQPMAFSSQDIVIPSEIPHETAERVRKGKFLLPPINMLCSWHRGDIKDEDQFDLHISITAPDGVEVPFTAPIRFQFTSALVHRVYLTSIPMTGRIFGVSLLSVKIKPSEETEWHTAFTYPLIVEEIAATPPEPPQPFQEQ